MEPSGQRQGRLYRKYVAFFVALVSGVLLTSSLIQLYFTYTENQDAVIGLQREKAAAAASTIRQYLREVDIGLRWVAQPPEPGPPTLEQRASLFRTLLRLAPDIAELSYLDASGREQLRVSRGAANLVGSGGDFAEQPWFRDALDRTTGFGELYFRGASEPYLTVARTSDGPDGGVIAAEVSLSPIWQLVSELKLGESGQAYVVDARDQLIAHPDAALVARETDLTASLQVIAAREGIAETRQRLVELEAIYPLAESVVAVSQFDSDSQRLYRVSTERLIAYQTIEPPGWAVFVDQSLEEAYAPVRATILRSIALVVLGLALAVAASLVLAHKMLTPVRALRAGAARIGAGELDQRIEVRTGDELENLADEFNVMARRLGESYATLEQKVAERTRDLGEALERQTRLTQQNARLYEEIEAKSRELAEASRHKSEFLANMSHELRTPLNAIIGFSEVLLERMFGEVNEKQDEYLRDILESGQHLLSLINDVLDLSKVEAGRMELEVEPFSLADALASGVTMLKERAVRHDISLELEVEPGLDLIEADERKVKQIVFNLLSNAVKFTPDGGQVKITARRVAGAVEVAVRDTGVGLAPDDLEHLFDEFRQVGPAAARTEGTGLGLALTRRLVELHGGRIWVESKPGAGSTFTFTLPQQVLAHPTGPTMDGLPPGSAVSGA